MKNKKGKIKHEKQTEKTNINIKKERKNEKRKPFVGRPMWRVYDVIHDVWVSSCTPRLKRGIGAPDLLGGV